MADYQHHESKIEEPCETATATPAVVKIEEPEAVESTDRGLFDFLGKKKEDEKKCEDEKKKEDEVIAHEFEQKVQVCDEEEKKPEYYKEPEEEKKHETLGQKLHRSNSSSSSVSSIPLFHFSYFS